MELVLGQFPVREVCFRLPSYCALLPEGHPLRGEIRRYIGEVAERVCRYGDIRPALSEPSGSETVTGCEAIAMDAGEGTAEVRLVLPEELYYRTLSELSGVGVKCDGDVFREMCRLAEAARAYDRAIEHGAEPDPEFEKYLRNHPDCARKPGEDLLQTVSPEDEAAELIKKDPEMEKIIQERDANRMETPEVAPVADPAGVLEPSQAATPAFIEAAASDPAFQEQLKAIYSDVQAAPTPSPAGAGHETDKSRFGTVRVRVEGRRNRIKLRFKRPEIQRVRKRGGDIEVLKKK
jgi:hypothetical protein